MNKVYKGYELMEEIAKGNIKTGSKFRDINEKEINDNRNIYIYKNNNIIGRFGGTNLIALLKHEFELIEEQIIDIDSIEELEIEKLHINGSATDRIAQKLNEIIRAVKHLNKEIQSIKEK